MTSASIRYNNPGAMWPGPSSQRFGANGYETIGGGNKIAVFDDPVAFSNGVANTDISGVDTDGTNTIDVGGSRIMSATDASYAVSHNDNSYLGFISFR